MKLFYSFLFIIFSLTLLSEENGLCQDNIIPANQNQMDKQIEWIPLPDYPIEGGISAPYIGVHNGKLIVAGGCNFPDIPAAQGGEKAFYKCLYLLDISGDQKGTRWKKGKDLPYEVAYGSSMNTDKGIICIGGQNKNSSLSEVFLIQYDEELNDVNFISLPPLPVKVFNAGASIINNKIYVTGGINSNNEKGVIYILDLDKLKNGWFTINIPTVHERQQPVVIGQDNKLFIAGGYDEKEAKVFTDISRFELQTNRWDKYADIISGDQQISTFIGAGGISYQSDYILFAGGVNYECFTSALERIRKTREASETGNIKLVDSLQQAGKEYMNQEIEWYKFNRSLSLFNIQTKKWSFLGDYEQSARAGAGITVRKDELYVICGELKPGIRTNKSNYAKLAIKNESEKQ